MKPLFGIRMLRMLATQSESFDERLSAEELEIVKFCEILSTVI